MLCLIIINHVPVYVNFNRVMAEGNSAWCRKCLCVGDSTIQKQKHVLSLATGMAVSWNNFHMNNKRLS